MNNRSRFLQPGNAHALIASLLLGGVGIALTGLQRSLSQAEQAVRPALKVAVFIQAKVTDKDGEAWSRTLPALDPEIESAEYVSRVDALKRAQGNPALTKSLLLLRDNPFPASVVLHYRDQAWLDRPEPALTLKGLPQVQEIRWDPESRTIFRWVHEWSLKVQKMALVALIAGGLSLALSLSRGFFLLLVLAPLPFLCYADASDALLKRYEKQIHQQERQLSGLRARLADKEKDVARWQSKAESAKTEWNQASARMEETRAEIKRVHEQRQKTRLLADAAQWKTAENVLLSRSADEEAHALAQDLYKSGVAPSFSSQLTVEETASAFVLAPMAALSASSQVSAQAAQKEEADLRGEEIHWQTEEMARSQDADRLHQKEEDEWLKWQDALRRKTAVEDDISQIDQSAKALQVMLDELRAHRDQAIALRENRSANEEAVASLRGTLPWPAQGKVVQNFGRQYSQDLNQLVVSNGIRIDSGAHHVVRAVQDGKVLFANLFREYGQLVIIQHKNGLTSVYGGLGETQVKEGQVLAALDQVGVTGEGGSFYFELRRDEEPLNPLAYLAPHASSELSLRRTFR